ncbi:hypothetical protein D3C85_1496510 [compost metagenome]
MLVATWYNPGGAIFLGEIVHSPDGTYFNMEVHRKMIIPIPGTFITMKKLSFLTRINAYDLGKVKLHRRCISTQELSSRS